MAEVPDMTGGNRQSPGRKRASAEDIAEHVDESVLHRLSNLTKEELLELIRRQYEAGVRIGFPGKNNARQIARRVQPRVVRRLAKYSVGPEEEQARNLIVEGENLQALTTLYRERGQVDLILTDPPYNTGKDFRYNDRWDDDPNDPSLGELVSEDDGARHTKWMKFMWPRLQMLKDMLKPTGVLAICIDYRELFRLGQMLDELFGQSNRLAIINWEKSYSPRGDQTHVSTTTEYVLVYAKDERRAQTQLLPRTEEMDERYGSPDGDARLWASDNPTGPGAATHPGMTYGIQSPFTGALHYPAGEGCWRAERRNMKAWLEQWGSEYESRELRDGRPSKPLVLKGARIQLPEREGDSPVPEPGDPVVKTARARARKVLENGVWPSLFFLKRGEGKPRIKRYLEHVKKGIVPTTYWADEDYFSPLVLGSVSWEHEQSGHHQSGINELDAIVGKGHGFQTVKPLKLFSKIIQIWCPPTGLVLDAFAGSGTSGHATLMLNRQSGASRRFILIEQGRPERGDPYARSLTADRMKRVITGEWASGPRDPFGSGFRFVALQKKVDAKAVLDMERDEMADAVIASHFDDSRRGPGLVNMVLEGYQYLVARNADDEGFFLVWDGSKKAPVFDESVYDSIVEEAEKVGLKPMYHVYARFNLFQSDDAKFYQIPNRILMDFGVSTINDAYHNEEAVRPVDLD
jgi:adenine-specific DNA-methyltransferase